MCVALGLVTLVPGSWSAGSSFGLCLGAAHSRLVLDIALHQQLGTSRHPGTVLGGLHRKP